MKTPSLIKTWWFFWIIGGIVGWIYLKAMPYMMNTDTISGFIALDYLDIFTEIPLIIGTILLLVLVRKISFNQEKKNQSLGL